MKKHILGLAIFSFIFVSFAFAFAFLCAPSLPKVEEVKTPVYISEKRSSCRKNVNKISYEIVSSQLDTQKNKLYTRVLLKWNGSDSAPSNVFANVELSIPTRNFVVSDSKNIVTAFNVRNSAEVLIESDANNFALNNRNESVYARYYFSEKFADAKADGGFSQYFPVVVAHENNATKLIKGQLVAR